MPYGVLLSGGLDSSIIAALARASCGDARRGRRAHRRPGGRGCTRFAIGLDRLARPGGGARGGRAHRHRASRVASSPSRRGSTPLPDVIHHLETYDVTTIRAATPMYLMARRIQRDGHQDGALGRGRRRDLRRLPLLPQGAERARSSTRRPCASSTRLHLYDCLRANKAMAAWGVEARVPFLDTRVPGRGDEHRARRQDVRRRRASRSTCCARLSPDLLPASDRLAPEGAVLRRRRLRLDRLAARHGRAGGDRRGVRRPRGHVPDQHAAVEGGVLLPRRVRAAFRRQRFGAADGAVREVGGVLDGGGAGLGCEPAAAR